MKKILLKDFLSNNELLNTEPIGLIYPNGNIIANTTELRHLDMIKKLGFDAKKYQKNNNSLEHEDFSNDNNIITFFVNKDKETYEYFFVAPKNDKLSDKQIDILFSFDSLYYNDKTEKVSLLTSLNIGPRWNLMPENNLTSKKLR